MNNSNKPQLVRIKSYDDEMNDIIQYKIMNGENVSDGYHTFNELYKHRTILFSVICNTHKDIAWKSKLHHDGTMYDGMFIVGIDTPDGTCTYHCENKFWDLFHVKELDNTPEWDGHTPDDVLIRIQSLSL